MKETKTSFVEKKLITLRFNEEKNGLQFSYMDKFKATEQIM